MNFDATGSDPSIADFSWQFNDSDARMHDNVQ